MPTAPLKFNTEDFLKDLGDQEISKDTINQAIDDDVEKEDFDKPLNEPERELPAPEPEKQPEPAKQEEAESVSRADYERMLQEQQAVYRQQMQEYINQQAQQQPSRQDEQYQFEDPLQRTQRELAELKQSLAEAEAERRSRSDFDNSVRAALAANPDLHDLIPRERMEASLNQALRDRAYLRPNWPGWGMVINAAYGQVAQQERKKLRDELSSLKDEVSKKREEKRVQAKSVSAGGAPFQKAQPSLDRNSRTYEIDKKTAFMAEMEAAGG